MRARSFLVLLLTSFSTALGCGGSAKPAESAEPAAASEPAPSESTPEPSSAEPSSSSGSSSELKVPDRCFKSGSVCAPEPKFVKQLCDGRFPSVALYLWANPAWTRGYLTRKTEAWNASGGASTGGFVEFDEEVLILFERKADAGGMQVSGAGAGYDALRWDGSCVTLSGEELTFTKPPAPKATSIDFRYLGDATQEALRKEEAVNEAYLERRRECKGATSGEVSLKCVKADKRLTDSIVKYLRSGEAKLPAPSKFE